jgi:uncharacterized membrane protein (UPF0182 family)
LVIPLEETLIYVEPIYLQAETAAYPELRLVAVMHNDQLSYAPTFDQALEGLFGEAAARAISPDAPAEASFRQLADQASQAFDRYLSALGEKDFTQASVELEKLQSTLNRLTKQAPATPSDTDDAP